jgi:diacylglycerol O-acyltransferase
MTVEGPSTYVGAMSNSLTALDATFLELEQMDEGATMHIGGVMVFDPVPHGDVPTLDAVCENIASRLTLLPRYSQRLSAERTGGLTWPRWEDDPKFDLRNHVHRAALPAPGGDAELSAWAADYFSHRLDRTRPLWELVLVEGLADGRWALVTKTHHALVDGVGSVDVVHLLLDAEPPALPAAAERQEPEHEPDSLWQALLRPPDTVSDIARTGTRAAAAGVNAARHPREALRKGRSVADLLVHGEIVGAPATSINVAIGATRRYRVVRVSLLEVKAIRHELGGSVNDVLLAACATGLRDLLLSRGEEPPVQGLRAMVPMNVRESSEGYALGNRVSSLFVELPVAESDPLERLREIVERTSRLKSSDAALGAATTLDLAALAPPFLHAPIARSLYATRLFNLTITNVPGPRTQLHAFGAPLRELQPIVPLAAGHAVGIAIFSYNGGVVIGISADHDSTPDLDVLVEGVERGFAELAQFASRT